MPVAAPAAAPAAAHLFYAMAHTFKYFLSAVDDAHSAFFGFGTDFFDAMADTFTNFFYTVDGAGAHFFGISGDCIAGFFGRCCGRGRSRGGGIGGCSFISQYCQRRKRESKSKGGGNGDILHSKVILKLLVSLPENLTFRQIPIICAKARACKLYSSSRS